MFHCLKSNITFISSMMALVRGGVQYQLQRLPEVDLAHTTWQLVLRCSCYLPIRLFSCFNVCSITTNIKLQDLISNLSEAFSSFIKEHFL